MKIRSVVALAALAISSILTRVLVVVALLASNLNAAPLQPSETRQSWQVSSHKSGVSLRTASDGQP